MGRRVATARSARPELLSVRILQFLATVLGPPLRLVWRLFFAWWLVPFFDWRFRVNFLGDIRHHFWFLFQERKGRKIGNPLGGPPNRDSTDIVVAADSLIFYFSKWYQNRDQEVRAEVAPQHAPRDSQKLWFALMSVDPSVPDVREHFPSMYSTALYLRPAFDALQTAFSPELFEITKQRIRYLEIYGPAPPS